MKEIAWISRCLLPAQSRYYCRLERFTLLGKSGLRAWQAPTFAFLSTVEKSFKRKNGSRVELGAEKLI